MQNDSGSTGCRPVCFVEQGVQTKLLLMLCQQEDGESLEADQAADDGSSPSGD